MKNKVKKRQQVLPGCIGLKIKKKNADIKPCEMQQIIRNLFEGYIFNPNEIVCKNQG